MIGRTEWGLRAIQDESGSTSWSGHNVFDVKAKSQAAALDGTKYSDWQKFSEKDCREAASKHAVADCDITVP